MGVLINPYTSFGGGGGAPGGSVLLPFGPPASSQLSSRIQYGALTSGGSTGLTQPSGLVSLVLFNEGAGLPFDLAAQRPCTLGGTPAWVSGLTGWAGSSTTINDYYVLPANGVFESVPAGQVTIAIIRKKRDTTLRTGSLFGVPSGGGLEGRRCGAHVPFSDGTVYWDFGGASGSNRLTWTGYSVSTAIEKWVFVAGSKGMAIYFNGKLVNSSSTGISRSTSADGFRIGSGNGSSSAADLADYLFFAMINQQWGQGEVTQWVLNPYSILGQPTYLQLS